LSFSSRMVGRVKLLRQAEIELPLSVLSWSGPMIAGSF
jgi:hypothetical protein